MVESFNGFFTNIIEVFKDTLEQDTQFNSAVGDDFSKMTYPAASYIPDTSSYQSEMEYTDTHTVLFVFEKESDHINLQQNIGEMETAVDALINGFETTGFIGQAKPTNFNFLVADNSGTRLNVVEVEFSFSKLQEFGDYT